jgi:predicted metalloendopeptidase
LSENLDGIGAVIAHEITHAFDPNGSKFDEFGNIRNWWSKEDYNKFTELSQAEIELFDGIICGGLKTNGKLTVGENVADLGGLTVAVETAKKENGNLQELFQAWAKIWRGKMMPQFRKSIIAYDSHMPQVNSDQMYLLSALMISIKLLISSQPTECGLIPRRGFIFGKKSKFYWEFLVRTKKQGRFS